jgi:hypothetical protein
MFERQKPLLSTLWEIHQPNDLIRHFSDTFNSIINFILFEILNSTRHIFNNFVSFVYIYFLPLLFIWPFKTIISEFVVSNLC